MEVRKRKEKKKEKDATSFAVSHVECKACINFIIFLPIWSRVLILTYQAVSIAHPYPSLSSTPYITEMEDEIAINRRKA